MDRPRSWPRRRGRRGLPQEGHPVLTPRARKPTRYACLAVALALAAAVAWWLRAGAPRPWENDGSYPGPLTRSVKPFDPALPPSRPWLDPDRAAPPPTRYRTYRASSLGGRETDYLLYLPPGYDDPADRDRRYPVVYWLHGYGAHPQHGQGFVEVLDQAVRAGVAPPVIAVLPNGLVNSWYVDAADGSQPVESVIVNDLVPHVDATYRTIATPRGRALEGFSMGGWGAAHLAFKFPDVFGAVTMVGAPVHTPATFIRWHKPEWEKLFGGDEAAFYAEEPVTRARRHAADLRGRVRVRGLAGEQDGNKGWTRGFCRRLADWGYEAGFTEVPGVGHSDADLYVALGPEAFRAYHALFAGSASVPR